MTTSNRRSINLQTRKEENPETLERTRHNARGNLNSHEQPAHRASHRHTTKGVGMSESRKGFCRGPFQPLVRAFSRLPPSTGGVGIDKFIKIDAG